MYFQYQSLTKFSPSYDSKTDSFPVTNCLQYTEFIVLKQLSVNAYFGVTFIRFHLCLLLFTSISPFATKMSLMLKKISTKTRYLLRDLVRSPLVLFRDLPFVITLFGIFRTLSTLVGSLTTLFFTASRQL